MVTHGSTYRSIGRRPSVQPPAMATASPVARYRAAICQPNSPKSRMSATSLTIGAEMRNENVTPSGTPAVTKPMKSGTAEHEQNGVTMPSAAANTLATISRRPAIRRRVRAGVKNERTTPMPKTTSTSSIRTFGAS